MELVELKKDNDELKLRMGINEGDIIKLKKEMVELKEVLQMSIMPKVIDLKMDSLELIKDNLKNERMTEQNGTNSV